MAIVDDLLGSSSRLFQLGVGTARAIFDATGLTAARIFTLPDRGGELALSAGRSRVDVTGSKTLALTDLGTFQYCTNSSAATITIPLNASVSFPDNGEIELAKFGTGSLSIGGSVTVLGYGGSTLTLPYAISNGGTLKKVGTDTWLFMGA